MSFWVGVPVKGSPTSRTQGCRRKQKSSDRSEEVEGLLDQSARRRRLISIAVKIVDRNCLIRNFIVRLITIPAGEPRQNSLDGWFILAQSADIRSMAVVAPKLRILAGRCCCSRR